MAEVKASISVICMVGILSFQMERHLEILMNGDDSAAGPCEVSWRRKKLATKGGSMAC